MNYATPDRFDLAKGDTCAKPRKSPSTVPIAGDREEADDEIAKNEARDLLLRDPEQQRRPFGQRLHKRPPSGWG